jgi:ClpP class serine protease
LAGKVLLNLILSYLEPTKIFFSNLNSQWNKLTEQTETLKREDDEIIEMFVERVKENMKTEWEEKIVKKEGDFASAKML